jgi:hypothetical protein
MTTRQLYVVTAAVIGLLLADGTRASAQGTVNWANGFPVINNSNPPMVPFPSIDVMGTVTANAGWTLSGVSFNWIPAAGGPVNGVPLDVQNGVCGQAGPGGVGIGAKHVTMTAGTYNIYISALFSRPNPNGPGMEVRAVASGIFQPTIR